MKKAYLLSILTIVLFQYALSQQTFSRIPQSIVDTLNRQYPGWHLANNMNILKDPEVISEYLDTTICMPNLVWGDFDNDKRLDYAIYAQRTNSSGKLEEMLVVFLSRGLIFREFVLKDVIEPVYIANYIWLAKKGTKESVFVGAEDTTTRDNTFVLKSDAIDLIVIGKASEVVLYNNGNFSAILTGD
ncbi:MAG: hypothetical protein ABSC53_14055 [Bacteroidota bacterium]